MAELTEQQKHLSSLLNQRTELVAEINELNAQAASKRELVLRSSGAIEYLQQVGVTLPEPEAEGEAAAPEGEAPTPETEELPEPQPEG
jgi:septal ring factor EnvC (AmiA/AmiB activator)